MRRQHKKITKSKQAETASQRYKEGPLWARRHTWIENSPAAKEKAFNAKLNVSLHKGVKKHGKQRACQITAFVGERLPLL